MASVTHNSHFTKYNLNQNKYYQCRAYTCCISIYLDKLMDQHCSTCSDILHVEEPDKSQAQGHLASSSTTCFILWSLIRFTILLLLLYKKQNLRGYDRVPSTSVLGPITRRKTLPITWLRFKVFEACIYDTQTWWMCCFFSLMASCWGSICFFKSFSWQSRTNFSFSKSWFFFFRLEMMFSWVCSEFD